MAERIGLGTIPGVGWRAKDIQTIAREAEDAGFDGVFAAEVNNDVMATAQLMGAATTRLQGMDLNGWETTMSRLPYWYKG